MWVEMLIHVCSLFHVPSSPEAASPSVGKSVPMK